MHNLEVQSDCTFSWIAFRGSTVEAVFSYQSHTTPFSALLLRPLHSAIPSASVVILRIFHVIQNVHRTCKSVLVYGVVHFL